MIHSGAQADLGDFLFRPLANGRSITYWQLGATSQTPFDVADQPMEGEMDPFFFVTKQKNFIPHEYPCRTEFIAKYRRVKPVPGIAFSPRTSWLPFGATHLDLSGFWFRATHLETWARTCLTTERAGMAQFKLSTCGGAILFVNGAEVGWMAPYQRNFQSAKTFCVDLNAGENEIRVYFDDLAERDGRYLFGLDYVDGPPAKQALPTENAAHHAHHIEAALAGMHFEKLSYTGGEVALVTDTPLAAGTDISIKVEGDFMSTENLELNVSPVGASCRIPIARTEDLPADFRHFHVSLSAGGYTASRVFGVEICHVERQGAAPPTLKSRIAEALDEVGEFGEPDSVCALARLATGKGGEKTDRMLAGVLRAIKECHDCADFILVPLLWCRQIYGEDIGGATRSKIDRAILDFRYWMDEPGNDVQWYFSENHALLFHTAAYLAGGMFASSTFMRSGRTGVEQSATGGARVRAWLDHFERCEMAEFNSAPYFPIDLKGLTALFALAPDADIRRRAGAAIARLLEIVANSAHHGALTAAQGRSYEHTLRAGRSLELSAMMRMLWGTGNYGRRFHALPQLALCLKEFGLTLPDELGHRADFGDEGALEWCFSQGENSIAKLYHFKNTNYAMGSAANYRCNEWGYQETLLHLRIGTNPDAQVWINHPGEMIHSGYARPSFWGGSGTLPRVHQYKGLALVCFDCNAEQLDFTHAWFPLDIFDQTSLGANFAAAKSGEGFVFLKTKNPLELVTHGPTANAELRQKGRKATWIVRIDDTANSPSLSAITERFSDLRILKTEDGALIVQDPEYGPVRFCVNGRIEGEGRVLDPSSWTIQGKLTGIRDRNSRKIMNLPEGLNTTRNGPRPATPTDAMPSN
jgi:hypothetical protein